MSIFDSFKPGKAFIHDGNIVVFVPVDTIKIALEANPRYGEYSHFAEHITDLDEFAKDVVYALNDEEEDGTTLVHKMFDEAMVNAIDDGSMNIDYDAAEKQLKERGW